MKLTTQLMHSTSEVMKTHSLHNSFSHFAVHDILNTHISLKHEMVIIMKICGSKACFNHNGKSQLEFITIVSVGSFMI
jgi:hypothetical protein